MVKDQLAKVTAQRDHAEATLDIRDGIIPRNAPEMTFDAGTDAVDAIVHLIRGCGLAVDETGLRRQVEAKSRARGFAVPVTLVSGFHVPAYAIDQLLQELGLMWEIRDGEVITRPHERHAR